MKKTKQYLFWKKIDVLVFVLLSFRFKDFAFLFCTLSSADFQDIENTFILKADLLKRNLSVRANIQVETIWIAYTMMRTINKLFNDVLNFLIAGYRRKGIQDVTGWFSRQWTSTENRCSRRETERGIKYQQVWLLFKFWIFTLLNQKLFCNGELLRENP